MIEYPNGARLVEQVSELPNLFGEDTLYVDLETTSHDPKRDALNPWHSSFVAGVCITTQDAIGGWYIPLDHQYGPVLPRDHVIVWLNQVFNGVKRWVNHNIKYDAHVLANDLGIKPEVELIDTLTLAKIIDSDRGLKGGYGLKALSKDWLGENIDEYSEPFDKYLHRNKDFGRIPSDLMAPYGVQDVITNRRLYKYIDDMCPEDCRRVWDTEIELTSVLLDIERNGVCVDPQALRIAEVLNITRMLKLEEELEKLVGFAFRPHATEDCYDVLCNNYGLPVLGRTKEGNPSFNKATMAKYVAHPQSPPEVVERIMEYRQLNTLNNLFVTKFQALNIDGMLHSDYNQTVSTGRLSCHNPNAQQNSKESKKLIIPRKGNSILTCDYSQIEFRLIVHYIKDKACIEAYLNDPHTDFHQWVADMIPMARKPAKNVNFMMGYGGGKAKCVEMLASNKEVVGELLAQVEAMVQAGEITTNEEREAVFKRLCTRKANGVYTKYHDTLPGLQRTSWDAARVCKQRGYVKNLRGRRRHLPSIVAHKAFNSLCQSSAADIMKERTVALWKMLRGTPINIIGSIHDDTLMEAPSDVFDDPRVVVNIVAKLEAIDVPLRVPLRCSAGLSSRSWYHAAEADSPVLGARPPEPSLEFLKSGS